MTPTRGRWWALVALSFAVLAVGIDLTVLNVALPTLGESLHASTSQLQWFVDSYSLVLAALLLPAGILADRLGRKRLLLIALTVFAATSAACAYAGSPSALVGARALLGVGAAVILTVSLSILAVLFPTDEERLKATALVMGSTMLGYPLGPLIGGWLLDRFWWGSVFLINVPVAVVALVVIALLMPESRRAHAPRLDGAGVLLTSLLLSTLGLVGVTYGVIQAGQDGWGSRGAIAALVAGVAALAAFVAWERRVPAHHGEPLIDLGLFRSARFTWGTVLATMVSFALFGLLFAMPQYFQGVMGVGPLGSGTRMLPFIGGFVVGAGLATRLQGSRSGGEMLTPARPMVGVNVVATLGFAFMAAALFFGAATAVGSSTGRTALWFVVCGFGLGFALPATMSVALGALSPEQAGVGSGLLMVCRQVGATIGVAVLGTVLNSVYRDHLDVAGVPAAVAGLARDGVATGSIVAQKLGDVALGRSVRSAFVTSLDVMLVVCGGIAVGALFLALAFLPRRSGSTPTPIRASGEVVSADDRLPGSTLGAAVSSQTP